jgi:fructokinase
MPTRPLILALGEILWDLLPNGKQLGGAPANFAYHAAQLGADARVISAVGDDPLGHEILARLRAQGLDTSAIRVDDRWPTGTVTVSVDAHGQPTYQIEENVAWDRIGPKPEVLELARHCECLCFGTLAQRSKQGRIALNFLTARSILPATAHRILDINFRQHFYDQHVVERSLRQATVLKLNDDEMPRLAQIIERPAAAIESTLFDTYPRLTLIALTRGGHGSLLIRRDGSRFDHPGHPASPLVDTIGAGDAFTAALAVGPLANRPLAEINDAANRLAAYVCTQPGATPPIPADLRARL